MAKNPEDYAIVIGIDGYSQLRPLKAARSDAQEFTKWLVSPDGGGLPDSPEHVQVIKSPDSLPNDPDLAEPLKATIDRALRDFGIKNDERIGRRLYFYFAGHGFGPEFDDVGMLMANAASDTLNNVGLQPYRKLFFDRGPFDQLVFILDCCRDSNKKKKAGEPDFALDAKVPTPKVLDFVVLAAAYGEKAFERNTSTDERRGVLTKALLEALRGENPDAIDEYDRVTTATLSKVVKARLEGLTTDEKLRQNPQFILPNPEIVLCTIDPAKIPNRTIRIIAQKGLTGDLLLCDGLSFKELKRTPAQSATEEQPWEFLLPLRNSYYAIMHTESDAELVFNPARIKKDPYVKRFPAPE